MTLKLAKLYDEYCPEHYAERASHVSQAKMVDDYYRLNARMKVETPFIAFGLGVDLCGAPVNGLALFVRRCLGLFEVNLSYGGSVDQTIRLDPCVIHDLHSWLGEVIKQGTRTGVKWT